jgi:hypothetical protein
VPVDVPPADTGRTAGRPRLRGGRWRDLVSKLLWPLAATLAGYGLLDLLALADRRGQPTLAGAGWLVAALRTSGTWVATSAREHFWLLVCAIALATLVTAILVARRRGWLDDAVRQALALPLVLLAVLASGTGHLAVAVGVGALLAAVIVSGSPPTEDAAPTWARLALGAVVVLAVVLRCFDLASFPPGYAEHAAVHHAALSLPLYEEIRSALHRGDWEGMRSLVAVVIHDQHGPDALVTAVGFSLFGVTLVITQLVTAALGVLTVLAAYRFGRTLANWRTGLLLAMLLAVSPWHLSISRYADAEHVLAPLLAFVALTCLVRALDSHRAVDAAAAGALLGVSWYVYAPAQILPLLAAMVTLVHALRGRPWRRRGALALALGVVTFSAISVPAMLDFAERGRLVPIRSSYEEDKGLALFRPSRVAALAGKELEEAFVRTDDPWFEHDGGGLGAVEAALLLPALVLVAAWLRDDRFRDRSVLILLGLALSLLPAVLAPDESFRRLFLFATFALVLAAVLLGRTLEGAEAGVPRPLIAGGLAVAAFALAAVNTHVYFDTVDLHESSAHLYHREMAELVNRELGHEFVTIVAASASDAADHERYIALAGYERLQALEGKGIQPADLYRIVPADDLVGAGTAAAILERGGVLVAADAVLTQTAGGREIAAEVASLRPTPRSQHFGTGGGQPWTAWDLGGTSRDGRRLAGNGARP